MKNCPRCQVDRPQYKFFVKDGGGRFARCMVCQRETSKDWPREQRLLATYGITLGTYNRKLRQQKGLCVVCKEPPKDDRLLVVDHDHDSGKVRSLLCYRCNCALGSLEGDLFIGLLKYLRRHDPKHFEKAMKYVGETLKRKEKSESWNSAHSKVA